MIYKILTIDTKKFIIRNNDDGSQTGCTEGTVDYEEYLEWVAEGNTAEAAN
tara:strand:- start:274 stop:426 length:153 start_codon:yes stop_codon:yes gene_type:complete